MSALREMFLPRRYSGMLGRYENDVELVSAVSKAVQAAETGAMIQLGRYAGSALPVIWAHGHWGIPIPEPSRLASS